MAIFFPYSGEKSELDQVSTYVSGRFFFLTDTGTIEVDTNNSRVKINSYGLV